MTSTATYTDTVYIAIDGVQQTGLTYDADGGTWKDQVRALLADHGYDTTGEWSVDTTGDATISGRWHEEAQADARVAL